MFDRPSHQPPRRRFLLTLFAVVITLGIGTVGFVLIDHYPPFDAFYMTSSP